MEFRFDRACLESLGYVLPAESVTSAQIEARLAPLYERLRLPEGRLELISGIQTRRLWAPGTRPSEPATEACRRALVAADIAPEACGAIVHTSVCRDFLEPATACVIHGRLGLSAPCAAYDVSNACLGFLNGLVQVGSMIELGQIRAGLVVACEGSRDILEATIDDLNHDPRWTRDCVKSALASLTLGSAAVAAVLVHRDISRTKNRLLGGIAHAASAHVGLCHSLHTTDMATDARPRMRTDAEQLLAAGLEAAVPAFARFLDHLGWRRAQVSRTFCHQVGTAHRRAMLRALELDADRDSSTVEFLGNTGSAALPVTMALAAEQGHIRSGEQVALLGIGSGINLMMLAIAWQHSAVLGGTLEPSNVADTAKRDLPSPHHMGTPSRRRSLESSER